MNDDGYKRAMAQLDNPDVVRQMAAKHGLKLAEDEKPKRDRPKGIELGEDAGIPELSNAINTLLGGIFDYLDGRLNDEFSFREGQAKKKDAETKRNAEKVKVEQFIKDHSDFNDHWDKINEIYGKGYSIEEAYDMARKLKGITGEPQKKEKETPVRKEFETPPAAAAASNASIAQENLQTKNPKTLLDVIKSHATEQKKTHGDIFSNLD